MKKIKIMLTNSPMVNGNRGCVALTTSTMYIIGKLLSKANIEYEFILPNNGQNIFGEFKLGEICGGIKYMAIRELNIFGMKNKVISFLRIRETKKSYKVYKEIDYVLDIGQGDSFSDIYGPGRFNSINNAYKNARQLKKPLCVLPQTIGPFTDDCVRKEAVKSLKNASCIMVRDKQSLEYVKELLPDKECTEIIDVAFFMPYTREKFSKDKIHVGLNVSALLWNGGYTRNNQFGLKDDYKKTIRKVIEYFLSIENVQLHLVPHVVGGERNIENDYEVSYEIAREYNNSKITLAPLFLDPIIAKGYIAGMDFFMGARMHATIGAFSSGVPVVPMAYSRKFNGLFEETLDYGNLADLKTKTSDEIVDIVSKAYEKRVQLKDIIKQRMKGVVRERGELLEKKLAEFFGI